MDTGTGTGAGTDTEVSGLTPACVYYFRCRALTRAGQRDYSHVVSLVVRNRREKLVSERLGGIVTQRVELRLGTPDHSAETVARLRATIKPSRIGLLGMSGQSRARQERQRVLVCDRLGALHPHWRGKMQPWYDPADAIREQRARLLVQPSLPESRRWRRRRWQQRHSNHRPNVVHHVMKITSASEAGQ